MNSDMERGEIFDYDHIIELDVNSFIKQLAWSSDDRLLVTSTEDNQLVTFTTETISENKQLNPQGNVQLENTIHDISLYPWIQNSLPETCLVLVAGREMPLQLINTSSGTKIATFLANDANNQVAQAINCCVFSPDGLAGLVGSLHFIHRFDIWNGQNNECQRWKSGLRGPISCLTTRHDSSYLLAAGSFGGDLALYDHRLEKPLVVRLPEEHREGLTQLEFSRDGWSLFSVARRETVIRQWDLRQEAQVINLLGPRPSSSYQRLYFSLNEKEDFSLYAGDQTGHLLHFELSPNGADGKQFVLESKNTTYTQPSHRQSIMPNLPCNAVDINNEGRIAVACGHRVFNLPSSPSSNNSTSDDEESNSLTAPPTGQSTASPKLVIGRLKNV